MSRTQNAAFIHFSFRDWSAACRNLNEGEELVLGRLIREIMAHGGALADDARLPRRLGIQPRRWASIRQVLLDLDRITIEAGMVSMAWLMACIERTNRRIEQARDAAQKAIPARDRARKQAAETPAVNFANPLENNETAVPDGHRPVITSAGGQTLHANLDKALINNETVVPDGAAGFPAGIQNAPNENGHFYPSGCPAKSLENNETAVPDGDLSVHLTVNSNKSNNNPPTPLAGSGPAVAGQVSGGPVMPGLRTPAWAPNDARLAVFRKAKERCALHWGDLVGFATRTGASAAERDLVTAWVGLAGGKVDLVTEAVCNAIDGHHARNGDAPGGLALFKNSVPEQLARLVAEHQPQTASKFSKLFQIIGDANKTDAVRLKRGELMQRYARGGQDAIEAERELFELASKLKVFVPRALVA